MLANLGGWVADFEVHGAVGGDRDGAGAFAGGDVWGGSGVVVRHREEEEPRGKGGHGCGRVEAAGRTGR